MHAQVIHPLSLVSIKKGGLFIVVDCSLFANAARASRVLLHVYAVFFYVTEWYGTLVSYVQVKICFLLCYRVPGMEPWLSVLQSGALC